MNQFNNFTRFLCLRDPIVRIDPKVPVLDGSLHPYIQLRQYGGRLELAGPNNLNAVLAQRDRF